MTSSNHAAAPSAANVFVVGVGASGGQAGALVEAGIAALAGTPGVHMRSSSSRWENPAWGGATRAPFVNAAVVVETPLPAVSLLALLFSIERRWGRVRSQRKNQARTLDLDVLWSSGSSSSSSSPLLPHPRLLERSFAVIPAVAAMEAAGIAVPLVLAMAARRHGLAPLFVLGAGTNQREQGSRPRRPASQALSRTIASILG